MTEQPKPRPREPLPFFKSYTFRISLIFFAWVVFIQILFMSIFIYVPQIDAIMNRYSLSDMQSVGWASAIIVIYGVYKQEQTMWIKFGLKMGAEGIPTTEAEVSDDLLTEVNDYWREFFKPILSKLRVGWDKLTPSERNEILSDIETQIEKKMGEFKEHRGPVNVPVPDGRVKTGGMENDRKLHKSEMQEDGAPGRL